MNNEPVAWWDGKEPSVLGLSYFKNDYCPIPLYTHPHSEESVKAKTLTDEEIAKIKADAIRWLAQEHFDECLEDKPIQHWIRMVANRVEDGFFDAILKKASEK